MRRHLIIYILLSIILPAEAQQNVMRKLSPTVRMAVTHDLNSPRKSKADVKQKSICAFVKTTDATVIGDYGFDALADFGDIHIVSIPINRMLSFASDKRVLRVEAGRGTSAQMNDVPRQINALPVYQSTGLPQAFTGKNVVVGVQDIGFDLTHPNFYSKDLSTYRIKALWDQLAADTEGSEMYVGNEYRGQKSLLAYAHSRDGLKQGHGSHTLGIAAGSGYDSPYRGIAWESDLCLVSNAVSADLEFIADEDTEKYTYATDALGFKYIFDYAESVGKPCVINFSEGSRQDLYGDDLLYYEVLNRLTGPGRIIVASAGNNNLEESYIHKPKGRESSGTFLEKWGNYLYFLTTSDKEYTTRIVFHDTKNDTISVSSQWLCQQTDSLVTDTMLINGKQYILSAGAYPSCYDEKRLVVEFYLQGSDRIGMYSPSISAEIVGIDADAEMYKIVGNFVSKPADPKLCDGELTHDINSPSSSPDVISVGAITGRSCYTNVYGDVQTIDYIALGERSKYSSVGPTFDGRIKPDVVAPGDCVISSYNSFYIEANPDVGDNSDIVELFDFQGRTYDWRAETGTSMSSPVVAGIIALWLQAKPDLTKDQIMDIFAHTCTHPVAELNYPNNEYGYGQIDAYAGLLYLLGFDGVESISRHQPAEVQIRPLGNRQLTVQFPEPLLTDARVGVYSVSGQKLCQTVITKGCESAMITLPLGVEGIVAVQVNGDSTLTTGSTLVRIK